MKKLIFIFCLFISLGASAQRIYKVEGQPQRFVNALGIPVMPASYYNNSSDTALIFFDRNDTSTISFKFKGLVKKLAGSRLPWDSLTGVPSNFSTTYALSNDIQDSLLNKVSRNGSYANPSWITSLDYSKLTGTVPTWNQNTTGNAATVTNGVYTTGSYADPSWITGLAWSKISGAPAFITGINSTMVTTALGYTPENAANKGIANGYADLDAGGKIPASRIDFGQTGQTFVVASQSAMLAVSGANIGALAIRTDQNKNYRLIAQPASTLANWQVLLSPDAPVQSVNGFTGNVNLLTTHISEGSNYWWTAARSRAAQSLTTSGSSGAATYDNTTGVLNIPTYTLAGLGGQPALSGTGFVKISGTTISYDNSTYYLASNPNGYISGNQTITLSGDVSGSGTTAITTTIGALKVTNAMLAGSIDYAKMNAATVPTWNQNTTGTASNVTGIVAISNGGTGSATQNFVDLTTAQTVGGTKTYTSPINVTNQNINLSNAYFYSGKLVAGTNIALIGMNASDKVSIDPNGYGVVVGNTMALGGALSGTTLSMSGAGRFSGATGFSGLGGGISVNAALGLSSGMIHYIDNVAKAYTYSTGSSQILESVSGVDIRLISGGSLSLVAKPNRILVNTATDNVIDALQVAGSGLFMGAIKTSGDLFLKTTGAVVFNSDANLNTQIYHSAGRLIFYTGGGERASISSTGVATFSSTVAMPYLSITTGSNVLANINSTNATGGYLTWQTNGTTIADLGTATQIFGSGGSEVFGINGRGARAIAFGTNNTQRVIITPAGNVGINNAGSNARLEVVATSGEIFRADAAGGAYRIVAYQNGVNLAGIFYNGGQGTFDKPLYVGGFNGGYTAVSLGSIGGGYGSVGYNSDFRSTNDLYKASDFASKILFQSGGFQFLTAPSGTVGNPISWTNVLNILKSGAAAFGNTVLATSFTSNSRTTLGAAYIADNATSGNNVGIAFTSSGVISTDGNGSYSIKNFGSSSSRWGTINATTGDFSSTVTSTGFIKSGSSDSYFLLGGGGHVATSTYATTASLSSYVNTTGNQYEIGGNKSFLGAVEVVSLKTTGGPGTPGVLKFGGKTNDTVFTAGSQYVLPVNIDGTTYYIRLWAGIN